LNNNKTLLLITLALIPFVIISFVVKNDETNFSLEKKQKADKKIEDSINILLNGSIQNIELEEYIIGVVAGEMPASFDIEALKAQAIASRTYALYHKYKNNNNTYDLTGDINSQVYLTKDEMRNKWGGDYQKYYDKIKSAVITTNDQVIIYNNELIESFYFSMSSGNTQEAGYVFNENRDYLKSVESPYDNKYLKNFEVETVYDIEEFLNLLGISCTENIIGGIERNTAGYVTNLTICNSIIDGNDFRKKLNLRSTNFDINVLDQISIITKGYGHGVGMSQYGANGFAKAGYTYEDIIKHYYSGVEIRSIKDV